MSTGEDILLDLALSRSALDRDGIARRDPAVLRRALGDPATRVLELAGGKARTGRLDGELHLALRPPTLGDLDRLVLYLGRDTGGVAYLAVVRPDDEVDTSGRAWRTLREAGAELPDLEAGALTTAVALSEWHLRHPRCPRCGAQTEPVEGGWVRRCADDGTEHHPRTDPAVIVSVVDEDDRILLARGPSWPPGRLSVLAGFVEPGESFEAAVAREVMEEVGVPVQEVSYRGNQPWPFPASLMVGFTARATRTELRLDPVEIAQAQWFSRGELSWAARTGEVRLPPRVSIARHLVEAWYGGEIELLEETSGPFRGADPS